MSKCKDCKYCDIPALNRGFWYCSNPDVRLSAASIFDLPFNIRHVEHCFEPKDKE